MAIGWYPGHMAKARRELTTVMNQTDVVVELLDARLPHSSANPMLEELRGDRPCVKLLTKHDLADRNVTKLWLKHLERSSEVSALAVDARDSLLARKLVKLCRKLAPNARRAARVLVVGIPNVGKSTLINTLASKSVALVGNKPAVTRRTQHVNLKNGVHVWDSPGILWPNLVDQDGAYRLAASGAIGINAHDPYDVALFAVTYLMATYPERLKERYKLDELPIEPDQVIELIGRHRACFIRKGEVDLERTAGVILRELRAGTIGYISFETPPEVPPEVDARDEPNAPAAAETTSQPEEPTP
ncbi:MAG: ribosome biogenesis GTPase A [Myxococcota bacterium]|jgi:ribosome biogenesis GTPase A